MTQLEVSHSYVKISCTNKMSYLHVVRLLLRFVAYAGVVVVVVGTNYTVLDKC